MPESCDNNSTPIPEPWEEAQVFVWIYIWPGWPGGGMHRLTEKARLYLRQAEHCYRLAEQCTDRHRAADLNVLGSDFLNKAARIENHALSRMRGSHLQP